MKVLEILGMILVFGGIVQLIKWMLDSLGVNNLVGETLTFLISIIFTTLIVIVVIQIQQNKGIKRLEARLKIKEEKGFIEKTMEKIKGKKGMVIDPKILFWILIIILFYLFLKSLGFFN